MKDNKDSFLPILRGYTALGNNRPLGVPSDKWLQNIGYLRLKNITVGYTLPQALTSKVFVSKLRLYVSAANVLTFTKYDGFDPEISSESVQLGIDRGVYPQVRSFQFGANLTF